MHSAQWLLLQMRKTAAVPEMLTRVSWPRGCSPGGGGPPGAGVRGGTWYTGTGSPPASSASSGLCEQALECRREVLLTAALLVHKRLRILNGP